MSDDRSDRESPAGAGIAAAVVNVVFDVIDRDPSISRAELTAELAANDELLRRLAVITLDWAKAALEDPEWSLPGRANHDRRRDGALDAAVWGETPSAAQTATAWEVGDRARRAAVADVLHDALTRGQAAERLGVSAQAVSERRKLGRLVAVRHGREWRFPAWQFGDDGVLPGLAGLIEAWPGTSLALSQWANRPSPDLGGATPAQELSRRGGPHRVTELLEAISAAAA